MPHASAQLTVDGLSAPVLEIFTPEPFDVPGAPLNPVTGRLKPVQMTIWGHWGWLAPLSPGTHAIHFEGGDGGTFRVELDYTITVAPA
jgi:hypothetical protein